MAENWLVLAVKVASACPFFFEENIMLEGHQDKSVQIILNLKVMQEGEHPPSLENF